MIEKSKLNRKMFVNFTGVFFYYVIIPSEGSKKNSFGTLKTEYRSFLQGSPGEAIARTHRKDGERAKGGRKRKALLNINPHSGRHIFETNY